MERGLWEWKLMELGRHPAVRSPDPQHQQELFPALRPGSGANGTQDGLISNGLGITDNGA